MDSTLTDEETILLMSDDTRRFANSEAGKFIIARLNQEIEQTQAEWVDTDPSDTIKIMQLQERYRLNTELIELKDMLISAGSDALDAINYRNEET